MDLQRHNTSYSVQLGPEAPAYSQVIIRPRAESNGSTVEYSMHPGWVQVFTPETSPRITLRSVLVEEAWDAETVMAACDTPDCALHPIRKFTL